VLGPWALPSGCFEICSCSRVLLFALSARSAFSCLTPCVHLLHSILLRWNVYGASVTPTTAAVDGLALDFGGSAGSRAELPSLDVGPEAFPALTMGCWVRAEAGFGAGFAGSISSDSSAQAGAYLRSLLSGSAASEFDRALGIRATGSAGSADGSLGPAGWSLNTGRSYHEEVAAHGGVAGSSEIKEGLGGVLPVRYGQWSFVAAVYDQASRSAMLYVDGHSVTYERTVVGKGRGLGLLLGGSGTLLGTLAK
jgi:hypothetical protein